MSPRLARYLGKKGYSFLPSDSIEYTTNLVNRILSLRRQGVERRNDFIQMMVDREEEVKQEEKIDQQTDEQKLQSGMILKKSKDFLLVYL
jgi:siroheme synthase (precorrin-2 oxidase/ferrochelatase)